MGHDKARIDYQGLTFIERARLLLAEVGCDPVLVSGRPDFPGGIQDSSPGQGPAQAILDALDAIPPHCAGALFIPVDMPLLNAGDLLPLLSGDAARGRAWNKHPLPAFISARGGLPPREEVRSVKFLLSSLEIDWLELPEDRLSRFGNINSPEDLAQLTDRD